MSQNDMYNMISGERLQQLAHFYLGTHDDFEYNPLIFGQKEKHLSIDSLGHDNQWTDRLIGQKPCILFCSGHRIGDFSNLMDRICCPFILITHNSDQNIIWNGISDRIVNCPNLMIWYSQNLGFCHEKVRFLPIGLANSMWPHGNMSVFEGIDFLCLRKTKKTYMNFNIGTNRAVRQPCHDQLIGKLPFLPNVSFSEHIGRLSEYEFCICPEGNGFDTHRLWEALYLRVVPIVMASLFTDVLLAQGLPLVVLNSWSEYDESVLDYSGFVGRFDLDCLRLDYFQEIIC